MAIMIIDYANATLVCVPSSPSCVYDVASNGRLNLVLVVCDVHTGLALTSSITLDATGLGAVGTSQHMTIAARIRDPNGQGTLQSAHTDPPMPTTIDAANDVVRVDVPVRKGRTSFVLTALLS